MTSNVSAQCHCGAVVFNAELTDGLNTAQRCNCSFCRMRGAVVVAAGKIDVIRGKDKLTEYRFNTGVAAHYFCSVCGIYTFHQRRSSPETYGVNVACLAGVSPFDFPAVKVVDGIHHPKDGGKGGIAGILSYSPRQDSAEPAHRK